MIISDPKCRYEPKVYILNNEKIIYKIDCQCRDFNFRRLKRVGEFSEAKCFANPCKHLKKIVDLMEKAGYKLKVPVEMKGSNKCSKELRERLLIRANYKCESPGCECTYPLQIHRKTRANNGGKYNMENCVVLCQECHRERHYKEF